LKKAFDTNGIEIPFPQRTVWVNQVAERPAPAVETIKIREDLLGNRSGSDGDE
jgi:small-conductance mechanosensitive channel